MKLVCLLFFLFRIGMLPAQVKVARAEGRWEVSRDITPARAGQLALLEAKREALRLAGVPEEVRSATLSIQMADSLYFDDLHTEISTLQINGLVKVTGQQIDDFYDPLSGRITKIAIISAEVSLLSQRDASFTFLFSGLNSTYRNNESFHFSFASAQSCFLHLFVFDNAGGTLLYPGYYEKADTLYPGTRYLFPRNKLVEYTIEKISSSATYEQNVLLAVVTKTNVPFNGEVTVHTVFDWLYRIPSDQRSEQYFSFLVE